MQEKRIIVPVLLPTTKEFLVEQREEMERRVKQELPSEGNIYVYPIQRSIKYDGNTAWLHVKIKWVGNEEITEG